MNGSSVFNFRATILVAIIISSVFAPFQSFAETSQQCQAAFLFRKASTDLVEVKSSTEIALNDIKVTEEMFKLLVEENRIFFSLAFGKAVLHVADSYELKVSELIKNEANRLNFSNDVWERMIAQLKDPEIDKKIELGLNSEEVKAFLEELEAIDSDSDKKKMAISLMSQILEGTDFLSTVRSNILMVKSHDVYNKFMEPYRDPSRQMVATGKEVAIIAGLGFAAAQIAFWAAGITPVEVGFLANLGRTIGAAMPTEGLLMIVPTAMAFASRFGFARAGKTFGRIGEWWHRTALKRKIRRELKKAQGGGLDAISSAYLVRVSIAEDKIQGSLQTILDQPVRPNMTEKELSEVLSAASGFFAEFGHFFHTVANPVELSQLGMDIGTLRKKVQNIKKTAKGDINKIHTELRTANVLLNEKIRDFVEGKDGELGVVDNIERARNIFELYLDTLNQVVVDLDQVSSLSEAQKEAKKDVILGIISHGQAFTEKFADKIGSRDSEDIGTINMIISFARQLTLDLTSVTTNTNQREVEAALKKLRQDFDLLASNIERETSGKELTADFKSKTEGE